MALWRPAALRARLSTPALLYLTPEGVFENGERHAHLAGWCAAHPQQRARLIISGHALRSLVAGPDLPLDDEAALLSYARLQFSHYFGPAAQGWPMASWWVGDQRGVTAFAGEALPSAPWLQLRPSWCQALRHAAEADPVWAQAAHTALVLIEGQALSWVRLEQGRVADVQHRLLDAESDLQALLRELQDGSAAFSHAPQRLGWGAAGLPTEAGGAPWLAEPRRNDKHWPLPDFLPQRRRTPWLVWLWLLAAAATLAVLGQQALEQRHEADRLREQALVLSRLAMPPKAVATSPANTANSAANTTVARGRAWLVSRQLTQDWAQRWVDIETALPPGLQVTGLDLDARNLRLEGMAGDAEAVMQLVDRLAMQAQADEQEVVLTRLQRPDDGSALRFELQRRPAAPGGRS